MLFINVTTLGDTAVSASSSAAPNGPLPLTLDQAGLQSSTELPNGVPDGVPDVE